MPTPARKTHDAPPSHWDLLQPLFASLADRPDLLRELWPGPGDCPARTLSHGLRALVNRWAIDDPPTEAPPTNTATPGAKSLANPWDKWAGPTTTPAWSGGGPFPSAKMNIDGGSKGNPGPAGGGVVFTTMTGEPGHEIALRFPVMTNNQAEYRALLGGLRAARQRNIENLFVFSDSELVVKQIKGDYKIKNADLMPLVAEAQRLLRGFRQWRIVAIPREQNSRADALANYAIAGGPLTTEISD